MDRVLKSLLAEGRLDEVARRAEERTRVLAALMPLTYQPDPLLAWRAVEAMGMAAARVAETSPAAVREHLRRLMWLISEESGGQCWRAPEAMAEIVRRCGEEFADYIPIIVHLLGEMAEEDLVFFRPGILWAIGRLGPLARPEVDDVLPLITGALHDPNAQVRGLAVRALLECGRPELVKIDPLLAEDAGEVELYADGQLTRTTVRALAAAAGTVRGAGALAGSPPRTS